MARWIITLIVMVIVIAAYPLNAAEFRGSIASAQLPVKVRILDFKTTKRLCGSESPPHWCPAHLLESADGGPDVLKQELALDTSHTVTRARISSIKKARTDQ